jgi:hypothetical protein
VPNAPNGAVRLSIFAGHGFLEINRLTECEHLMLHVSSLPAVPVIILHVPNPAEPDYLRTVDQDEARAAIGATVNTCIPMLSRIICPVRRWAPIPRGSDSSGLRFAHSTYHASMQSLSQAVHHVPGNAWLRCNNFLGEGLRYPF